jgi:transposase
MDLELLWNVLEKKEELLITSRGITPLTALAFLADVGDIHRFKTVMR